MILVCTRKCHIFATKKNNINRSEIQAYCTFANTSLLVLGGPFRTCSSSFSISLLMSSRSSLGKIIIKVC